MAKPLAIDDTKAPCAGNTTVGTRRNTSISLLLAPTAHEHLHDGSARTHRHTDTHRTIHRNTTGPRCANDPSAGSPTETLLRLLLPLSDKVH
jgi:hypothetical protein